MQYILALAAALFVMSTAQGLSTNDSPVCFDEEHVDYITCSNETDSGPSVCDCGDDDEPCYVKLEITGRLKKFKINNGRFGPTIIVKHNGILAVDVINNIDEETSIHWHGMHQRNVPWMDGVADVTQYAIPKEGGKFRYILRAHPSGTHWYHSHVREQRDEGIVGALIVREDTGILGQLSNHPPLEEESIEDLPEQHTLSVTEHLVDESGVDRTLDNARLPQRSKSVKSFKINGLKLDAVVNEGVDEAPYYTVEKGKNYRFRVVGAMKEIVFRISIDDHKLIVVSTDSYLTKPFVTDVLHVHVGERYDFVVMTRDNVNPWTIFPIRIESVEVLKGHPFKPAAVGIAYLKYEGNVEIVRDHPCTGECIALNCPFQNYPEGYVPSYRCIDVYNALSLLVPTPADELPNDAAHKVFFDFIFNRGPTVNSVKNVLPNVPFAMSDGRVPGECVYNENPPCEGVECSHAVYVNQIPGSKSIEFVLSSLPKSTSEDNVVNLGTHPIHLHGHSFWVVKIAYPEYFENGTIEKANDDIEVPDCGHGHWSEGRPHITPVNDTTIRKDVITVPAGGYVVIRFRATNPGWWIMHCHIDPHLIGGMGIAVGEETDCQNPPPAAMKDPATTEFCWSVEEFIEKELFVCQTTRKSAKKPGVIADQEQLPYEPDEEFEDPDKSAGENYEEEWLNPRMILGKHMKKKQKWF
ncbi:laccase-like isoform X2 [Dendronephthya gigantea]|uniref:laccase-like isoform X2 n=1 Tax=Dendronephthya gigantea TaxID=151771 RepID=UPI001069D0F4|nr:laccase-like isoform X2 [Dendronephthya gigantea]XP_028396904.1 laccase-like isoform X2 [Dendronephthya gigantea]